MTNPSMPSQPTPPQPPVDPAARAAARGQRTRLIVGGILFALAVVFIVENRQTVAIRVIIPVVEMPLWAALTGIFVVGLLVGFFVGRRRRSG